MYVDYCWLSFVPPFKPSWATPCNVPRNNCRHLATTPSSTPRRGMPGRLAGTDKCGEYIGDLMAISWGFKGTPKKKTPKFLQISRSQLPMLPQRDAGAGHRGHGQGHRGPHGCDADEVALLGICRAAPKSNGRPERWGYIDGISCSSGWSVGYEWDMWKKYSGKRPQTVWGGSKRIIYFNVVDDDGEDDDMKWKGLCHCSLSLTGTCWTTVFEVTRSRTFT